MELKLSDKQLNKSLAKRIKQLLAITNQEPIIEIIIIMTRKQTVLYNFTMIGMHSFLNIENFTVKH